MSKLLSDGAKALRLSVSLALAAGLASTAPAALAQEEGAALEQRVQVTGSRIKRVDVETTSPVTVVTSEQILASGLTNVGDVLRNLNQADSLGLSNLTSFTNANDGTQTISLRGLDVGRTLVLVNGRRWLALGGGQVDITQVPVALVQRIEVLGDGASAIYGTDAIAGVINIILRDDYDGLEVEMSMGGNFEGDGESRSFGATLGVQGSRSGLAMNITKTEQNPIWSGDREISKYPVAFVPEFFGSSFGEFGIFNVPGRGFLCLDPDADQSSIDPSARTPQDFVPFDDPCRFNFAPTNYLLTPSDRLTAYAGGHYDVTDTVRAFAQFTFNQRKSITEIAAVPLTMGFSGPQWAIPISVDNLYNPFGVDINASGFRMSPLGGGRRSHQDFDTYFLTVGLEGMFTLADRAFDWDLAFSRGESTRNEIGENYVNLLNLRRGLGPSHIDPASGLPTCGTLADPTPVFGATPCVPINMFNGISGWTQEMLDYVSYTQVQRIDTALHSWEVNFTGGIVDLPAGELAFAAGAERRKNFFANTPDALIAAGLSSDNFREPTAGEQIAEEVYLELAIPLVRDVAGAQSLELNVAVRHSEFNNVGTFAGDSIDETFDSTNFKFGILWQPFDDLLVRANRSDTFRAPTVNQLFQGGQEGFPSASDPCASTGAGGGGWALLDAAGQQRCMDDGVPAGGTVQPTTQLRSLSGGNPNLLPEEGTTTTFGIVYNPGYLPGLDVSVDAWRVELDDALSFQAAGTVLNNWYGLGDPAFAGFFVREADGQLQTVRTGFFNLASIRMQGIDTNANYRFDTDGMGSFHFRLNATYTHEALLTVGDLGDATNVVGRGFGAFQAPTWKWRGNFTTNWNFGDFGATWTVRYLSPLIEPCGGGGTSPFLRTVFSVFDAAERELCSNPSDADVWVTSVTVVRDPDTGAVIDRIENTLTGFNRVPSYIYHDISGSWRAPWNATIRAGVRNVFDKEPPFMTTPFANSFDQAYDIPGPFWFVSYRQSL